MAFTNRKGRKPVMLDLSGSGIRYLRINSDQSTTALSESDFRDEIGAAPSAPVIGAIDASYTLDATDAVPSILGIASAVARTVTLPRDLDADLPIGSYGHVFRLGAGTVTFAAGSGAVVNSPGGVLTIDRRYGVVKWQKLAADSYYLTGDMEVSRFTTEASAAAPAIDVNKSDLFTLTALSANVTSFTTGLQGEPTEGQRLTVRIKDDGAPRTLAWGASFASRGATLPTTTVAGKYLYVDLIYNAAAAVWDCVHAAQEA